MVKSFRASSCGQTTKKNFATMKKVLIVIPMYKEILTDQEKISLKHLLHFLGEFDKCMIAPEGLSVDYPDFIVKRFEASFFNDIPSYSRLLLLREFYESFNEYQYILVYQLDSLVFSDELLKWCDMDYDYIGAPWFCVKTDPASGFEGVGNGGLSLRKIESFLKVFDSKRYNEERVSFWQDFFFAQLNDTKKLRFAKRLVKKTRILRAVRQGVNRYMADYTVEEDRFWGERARLFYPDFKIAPLDIAMRFAFDWQPQYCFEKNNRQLPFGCHGWVKLGREFWEPYILK
jgi:uncharacterized protein DUF5672